MANPAGRQNRTQEIQRILADSKTITDKRGNLYVRTTGAPRTDFNRVESNAAVAEAIGHIVRLMRSFPSESLVKDTLKAVALWRQQFDSTRWDVRCRISKTAEGYIYDHADAQGNCTQWSANGWRFGRNDTVPFIRTSASSTPEPVRPSSIEEAFDVIAEFQHLQGLPTLARLPRLAALIEDLKTDTPFVVRHNHGSAGSGKTTAAVLEIQLLDPFDGPVPPQVVPHIEHMAVAAQHRQHLFFDNVKRVEDEVSNFLCCAATGSPIMWRTMHERSGATTLSVHAPIQITGIHYHLASDLADRSLVTEFPVRSNYVPSSEIMAKFHANHGRYLGALFTLAVESLRRL